MGNSGCRKNGAGSPARSSPDAWYKSDGRIVVCGKVGPGDDAPRTDPRRSRHLQAPAEIRRLWGSAPGTPHGDRLDVQMVLADAYKVEHHAIEPPDPIEAIEVRMAELAIEMMRILAAKLNIVERCMLRHYDLAPRRPRLAGRAFTRTASSGRCAGSGPSTWAAKHFRRGADHAIIEMFSRSPKHHRRLHLAQLRPLRPVQHV